MKLKLEWWSTCDIGKIYYQGGYKNTVYLDADICRPSYDVLERGGENGAGVFIKNYSRFQKTCEMQVYVPEYLADSLSLIPLHDNIRITYTDGTYSGYIRNVNVNVEWDSDSNDCMGLVTITFQQDDQVVATNCCNNL